MLSGCDTTPEPEPAAIIPWAWHRAEDLTFLSPATPVAVWFATIRVANDDLDVIRRTQPVHFHDRAPLTGVFRIEADAPLSGAAITALTRLIVDIGETVRAGEVQLDFDALQSQRSSYRQLVAQIAARWAGSLSMTALASWCVHDNWLAEVSVHDVVPMLYRMGSDANTLRSTIARRLADGTAALAGPCAASVGYIADEEVIRVDPRTRVFLFNTEPWTAENFTDFRRKVRRRLAPQ